MKFFIFLFFFFGCTKNSEITKVCLEGHTYFNFNNMLALKVDDQGKPIKCPSDPTKNTKEIEKAAMDWIKLIDENDLAGSWNNTAPFFKNAIPQKDWEKKVTEGNRQLGKLIKRELQNSYDEGKKATVIFTSAYENLPQATETVSMILVDGKWMVVGYFIK